MDISRELYRRACAAIPGGVNSPVRAFRAVGGQPPFIKSAAGARLFDADGRGYIDYVGSWGPMILGHARAEVVDAVREAAAKGLSFGAPTEAEVLLAEKIREAMPSIGKLRLVNSGTEAVMSAVRLARGFTGRDRIVKFDGCYHGHADALLVGAGSGALTSGVPDSAGVPAAFAEQTTVLRYNDAAQVREVFARAGAEIACVIVEPVAGNMNFVPGDREFLKTLRECCHTHGVLLIFDEVMSGFRVAPGGAQSLCRITPDLTTLGKIIGGGLPVGAFGGRADIMEQLAPEGPVYQAGTLSGNPVAMAAGLKTLELLLQPGVFDSIAARTTQLAEGLRECAARADVPFYCDSLGAMFGLFFTDDAPVTSFAQVRQCDTDRFARFFTQMLEHGVYLAPSAFEAGFVSAAHSEDDITQTLDAADAALRAG